MLSREPLEHLLDHIEWADATIWAAAGAFGSLAESAVWPM